MARSPLLPEAVRQQKTNRSRRTMNEVFRTFSNGTSRLVGSPWAFFLAVLLIVLWAFSYSLFVRGPSGSPEHEAGFNTWQLVINTATTIVTFLMVFIIQNTQNRDAKATHLKLDELIRGLEGPRTQLVDLQNCTDEELDRLEDEFRRIHRREARKAAATEKVPGGATESTGRNGAPIIQGCESSVV